MGKRYVSPIVVCPYYKSQAGNLICCEGPVKDSSIHMAFSSPAEREIFQDRACKTNNYCEYCVVAKAHEFAWENQKEV